MARYPFQIILGVALMRQSPIFDSWLIISLSHPTPVGLDWREFGGLNLDLWVLGNGQVSISDQLRMILCLFKKGLISTGIFLKFPMVLLEQEFNLHLSSIILLNKVHI